MSTSSRTPGEEAERTATKAELEAERDKLDRAARLYARPYGRTLAAEAEAAHRAQAPAPSAVRLENLASVLGEALATWAARDDTKAHPGVRRAANEAVGAIDTMLAELHRTRQQLLDEARAYDDATNRRVDELLAARRDGAR